MDKKYHFIGIGGIGMSSLASILIDQNVKVSGTDISSSYVTDELKKRGAEIYIDHDPKYIKEDLTVIYGSGIKQDNPEFMEACRQRTKMYHRSDLLNSLMQGHKALAVTGSHGKTTTTALLTEMLIEANLDPSFSIGGIMKRGSCNGKYGKGEFFIAEADESDGTFLKYNPFGAIITNIGTDHMDYFVTKDRLKDSFKKFATRVQSKQHLFWCKESKYLREISPQGYGYGFSEDCDLRAKNFKQEGWKFRMDVSFKGKSYSNVECALIGHHNALNSLAVFGLGLELGLPEETIRYALSHFKGVRRRSDVILNEQGAPLFIDDYAHHPNEVASTLAGLRLALDERRLIAIFQPHRFSRVKECQGLFAGIFDASDFCYLTDIYAAHEKKLEGISSKLILEELENGLTPAEYVPMDKLEEHLMEKLLPTDAVVFMGAGDISSFGRKFAEKWSSLQKKEALAF